MKKKGFSLYGLADCRIRTDRELIAELSSSPDAVAEEWEASYSMERLYNRLTPAKKRVAAAAVELYKRRHAGLDRSQAIRCSGDIDRIMRPLIADLEMEEFWLLPMSLWYAVCAAHFFRDGKMMPVVWAGVVFALMFYLHPVSVAIPLGFAAGVLLFRRELFRREWRKFCAVGAGVLLVLSPYLYMCARGYSPGVGAPRVSFFTALGGVVKCWQNLTAFGFTDRFAPEVGLGIPGMWVVLSVPVIVFFMILGIIAVIRRWRRKELNTFDRLCVCGGITIVLFAAGLLILRVEPQAHYNSVVAFAWLLLAWRGFTVLRGDYRKTAAILLGAALMTELLFLADFTRLVHRYSGGSSAYFGTTLARQWRVVRSLTAAHLANPALAVEIEIDRFREDPLPLQVLIRLAARCGDLPDVGGAPRRARLLPARSGCGIDLILVE